MSAKRILLVDCDAFFAQCALLSDPNLEGKEIIVGGRADARGVVTSATYGLRPRGVRAGMPMSAAMRLAPEAHVCPVPGHMIEQKHDEILAVLSHFSPLVEAASVDEFYVDMRGTEKLYGNEPLHTTASRIRRSILKGTDISVSIGGGSNKLVAKMASDLAKPGGVKIVRGGKEEEFMRLFELRDIPGIGKSTLKDLARRGLQSVEDVQNLELGTLKNIVGGNRGFWLYSRVRGRGDDFVEVERKPKSMSQERTFPEDIRDVTKLRAVLLDTSFEISGKLRENGFWCKTITVHARSKNFKDRQVSKTLNSPVRTHKAIYEVAVSLFEKIREEDEFRSLRLLGVGLSGLTASGENVQLPLMESLEGEEVERDRELADSLDALRRKFGEEIIRPGGVLGKNKKRSD